MDSINKTLAEAEAFAAESLEAEAYYKYVGVILQILRLTGQEGFGLFKARSKPGGVDFEALLSQANEAFGKAEDELDAVLDLTEGDAEQKLQAAIVTGKQVDPEAPMTGLQLKRSPAVQAAPFAGPEGRLAEEGSAQSAREGPEFGPDIELNTKDESLLPPIPIGPLDVAQCQFYYELQLAVQHLETLAGASAKQQSNAAYLRSLRELIANFEALVKQGMAIAQALERSKALRILDIPPNEVARQLTLIQMESFRRVKEHDLLVPHEQRQYLAPNLYNLLALSKFICHWTQYEILRYESPERRQTVLGHLVRVAHCLVAMANFEGAKSMVAGLTATPIRRLGCSTHLNRRLHNRLDSLETLLSERRNFAQLRDTLTSTAAPCIPYVELYLRGLVNERFDHFQTSAYRDLFRPNPIVQHYLLAQPFRWEEELYAISKLRQSAADLVPDARQMPDQLTHQELERLSLAEADHYDRLRWGLQQSENFDPSPPPTIIPAASPSLR